MPVVKLPQGIELFTRESTEDWQAVGSTVLKGTEGWHSIHFSEELPEMGAHSSSKSNTALSGPESAN